MKRRVLAVVLAMSCILCACGKIEDESSSSVDKEAGGAAVTAVTTTATEAVTTAAPQEEPVEKAVILEFDSSNGGTYESASLVGVSPAEPSLEPYTRNVLHNGVVGLVGTPFMVEAGGGEMTLGFTMTDKALEAVPLENLIVLWYNEDEYYYEELYTEHDADSNTVSAQITESGVYMLTDWYIWGAAWGVDTSEYAHDTVFNSDEFDFEVTIPAGIVYSEVSDYWESQFSGMEEKSMLHQNDDGEVDIVLTGMRFTEEMQPEPLSQLTDEILEALASTDYGISIICHDKTEFDIGGGKKGYLMMYDFFDSDSNEALSSNVSGFYEYSDDIYIVLSFNVDGMMTDEMRKTLADAAQSFRYIDKNTN